MVLKEKFLAMLVIYTCYMYSSDITTVIPVSSLGKLLESIEKDLLLS